ncbi:MAG: sigma 54-interacting transcriptional regulator, partial [Myxococcota bacterium]|nr:sigma 54-interacting transcriptional regulator [Myxococcota bacterium]
GGTLVLAELGEISPAMQVRLLRVLQEREYEPLGSTRTVRTNVRVLAASNRELSELVESGQFRQDLYYRINVMKLELPPLRHRREDIPLLIERFIATFNQQQRKQISGISTDALGVLCAYDFPGNIRELQNIIERAFVLCQSGQLELQHLPPQLVPSAVVFDGQPSMSQRVNSVEAQSIRQALARNGNNRAKAARELGIHKSTLFRKVRALGLQLPEEDGRHRRTR